MDWNRTDRRSALQRIGALCAGAWAAPAFAADLPLKNHGIDHFGVTVPDPEATARFYGKLFDPQLFQERDPPPRFYVKMGTGYLAFGGNATATPFMDHFCTLTEGYAQGEIRKLLEGAGVQLTPGNQGMALDPDGLRLQTLNAPGGFARTIMPGPRISLDEPLFHVVGVSHATLRVSDLEKSAAHYKKIFGPEASRTKKPDRVWFTAASTRLSLELAAAGEKPSIHRVTWKIAAFDRKHAIEKLKRANVEAVPAGDRGVSFKDPHGLVTELIGV